VSAATASKASLTCSDLGKARATGVAGKRSAISIVARLSPVGWDSPASGGIGLVGRPLTALVGREIPGVGGCAWLRERCPISPHPGV
jgi:hypothetical protein